MSSVKNVSANIFILKGSAGYGEFMIKVIELKSSMHHGNAFLVRLQGNLFWHSMLNWEFREWKYILE
jgi:hypothetical protein